MTETPLERRDWAGEYTVGDAVLRVDKGGLLCLDGTYAVRWRTDDGLGGEVRVPLDATADDVVAALEAAGKQLIERRAQAAAEAEKSALRESLVAAIDEALAGAAPGVGIKQLIEASLQPRIEAILSEMRQQVVANGDKVLGLR